LPSLRPLKCQSFVKKILINIVKFIILCTKYFSRLFDAAKIIFAANFRDGEIGLKALHSLEEKCHFICLEILYKEFSSVYNRKIMV